MIEQKSELITMKSQTQTNELVESCEHQCLLSNTQENQSEALFK